MIILRNPESANFYQNDNNLLRNAQSYLNELEVRFGQCDDLAQSPNMFNHRL